MDYVWYIMILLSAFFKLVSLRWFKLVIIKCMQHDPLYVKQIVNYIDQSKGYRQFDLCFTQIGCTSYTFEVRVHKYYNHGHRLASGYCCEDHGKKSNCDSWWCLHCQCDNRFRFCFRHLGAPHDNKQYSCTLGGGYNTGKIGEESDSVNFGNMIGRLSNPFGFSGSQWPVREFK